MENDRNSLLSTRKTDLEKRNSEKNNSVRRRKQFQEWEEQSELLLLRKFTLYINVLKCAHIKYEIKVNQPCGWHFSSQNLSEMITRS